MSSIFSFGHPAEEEPGAAGALESGAGPALPGGGTGAAAAAAAISSLASAPAQMLAALETYLPAALPGLPAPSVILLTVNEAPVGLGNFIGLERRGPLAQVEVKGGRLDAVVRFQLWASNLNDVNAAVLDLQGRLLAARDDLWTAGFLRFVSEASEAASLDSTVNSWGRTVDYHALYEYTIDTQDAAQSLIARIPVHADQEVENSLPRETSVVTDELARWDDQGAPGLLRRGPAQVHALQALLFISAATPTSSVTLLRSFESASGPPADHPSLADFLTAVAGPSATARHDQVVLATLQDLLDQMSETGSPQALGDWDLDGTLDAYHTYELAFDPPIVLPTSQDRLEVTYGSAAFDQVAVMYIRLT